MRRGKNRMKPGHVGIGIRVWSVPLPVVKLPKVVPRSLRQVFKQARENQHGIGGGPGKIGGLICSSAERFEEPRLGSLIQHFAQELPFDCVQLGVGLMRWPWGTGR